MTCLRGLRVVGAALLALVAVSLPANALGATGSQAYGTPGEHAFTVPAGVSSLQVTLIGGTGGGGASDLRTCGLKCAGPALPSRLLVAGGGGGGGGEGGPAAVSGGPGGEGFFEPVLSFFENGGGGGGGGGSSGVPAAGAARVSGLTFLMTALGAEPSIAISWTIPTASQPSGSSPGPGVGSGPASTPPATSAVAPVLGVSGLTVTPARFRRGRRAASLSRTRVPAGATITFALTRSATVTLAVEQPRSGVRAGARCLAPRGSARHGRPCMRWQTLAHTIVRQAPIESTSRACWTAAHGSRPAATGSR